MQCKSRAELFRYNTTHLVCSFLFAMLFFLEDVEKRQNPVCHFVTPLDGNMDSGVHRPTEVSLYGLSFNFASI